MSSLLRSAVLGIVALFASVGTCAAGDIIQFSADAVQQSPDRPAMKARIYIGADAVRNEYEVNGQQFIEILRQKANERLVLNPDRKEYMIQPGPPSSVAQAKKATAKKRSPCEGVPNVRCEKKADEKHSGRAAEKWEFISMVNGREVRSLIWIDTKGQFPVKQMYPDGSMFEMTFVGEEKLDGRNTEKWEVVQKRPDGFSMRAWQWHDSKLKIAIRDELPGGYLRELKNIKVAKQPATLFDIPEGYQRIQSPAYSGQPPAPQFQAPGSR